jgi:LAO/AO transport system kinase
MEHQDGSFESALTERQGIDNVENVNPNLKNLLSKKNLLSVDEYFEGIVSGNRSILAKAITLIESEKSEHKILAKELLARL